MTDQLIGKVLADKYQIISLLSESPLGNFYRATHISMDKPVSVKVLSSDLASDEAAVKRFADEARTISRISHPNILNVTDYGSDKNGTIFIVYDDATGETLKSLIKGGAFSLQRANNIVQQAASALSLAHDSGIVHRNLNSENILVRQTSNGADEVKVLNFSSGQTYDAADFDQVNSVQAVEYFAPEQADSAKIDERSNVYSLGIILYELLTGEVPFAADNPTDLLLKHREQMPSPLSAFRKDLPPEVEQVLLTALAKNPDSRYQSVSDFADALNAAAASGVVSQPLGAPVGVVAAKETTQNNIWKTAFIVLAGVSLLSVFFIYSTRTKQTDPQTQLMTDVNGIPVQPVNPATGTTEQSLSNMNTFNPEMFSNANGATTMQQMPPGATTVAPGGDGYDPWANGGKPPAGAPTYVGPGGQQITVGDGSSVFMPGMQNDGNTYILVPKNANTAANSNTRVKNANTNTNTAANTSIRLPANTAANTANPQPKTSPTPNAKPSPAKPTPTPKKTASPSGTDDLD